MAELDGLFIVVSRNVHHPAGVDALSISMQCGIEGLCAAATARALFGNEAMCIS